MTFRTMSGCLVAIALSGCAATPPAARQPVTDRSHELPFPESWVGDWTGTLHIDSPNNPMTVAMSLNIQPTDDPETYLWQLQYGDGDDAQPVRDYRLVPVDRARGDWQIDEKNSIVLDANLRGGALWSQFDLGTNRIVIVYRFHEAIEDAPGLEVVLAAMNLDDERMTGGQGGVPDVVSQPVATGQRAVLRRRP